MLVAGIDYSLTNPAICIVPAKEIIKFEDCKFYCLTNNNKLLKSKFKSNNIEILPHQDFSCQEERHDNISHWVLTKLITSDVSKVFIEDYSFASKGRVFNIGENTGLLKHKLWQVKLPFLTIPPSNIKKYNTGSGAAKKSLLYKCFSDLTGVDLSATLNLPIKTDGEPVSPISDIIDSFFIVNYGIHSEKENLFIKG